MNWTPRDIANVMVIATICIIMLTIEFGIVTRSGPSDVGESRALLNDIIYMVIGLAAGFFVGKDAGKSN